MSEGSFGRKWEFDAGGSISDVKDFEAFIEKQANNMEQIGWMSEASQLRRWVRELRGKQPEKIFLAGAPFRR